MIPAKRMPVAPILSKQDIEAIASFNIKRACFYFSYNRTPIILYCFFNKRKEIIRTQARLLHFDSKLISSKENKLKLLHKTIEEWK